MGRISVDTSKFAYDPNKPKFISKLEEGFPSFKAYEEADYFKERLFTWIVFTYDINTPLRKEYPHYYARKVQAAHLAGFSPNKKTGKFQEKVESFLIGQDADINKLVIEYITSFSSPEYTQLIGLLAVQHKVMQDILSGHIETSTTKVMDDVAKKISELTRFLFQSGDIVEVEEARKALYAKAGDDLDKLRPESIAYMLNDLGELTEDFDYYDAGYHPEKITFAGDDPNMAPEDER